MFALIRWMLDGENTVFYDAFQDRRIKIFHPGVHPRWSRVCFITLLHRNTLGQVRVQGRVFMIESASNKFNVCRIFYFDYFKIVEKINNYLKLFQICDLNKKSVESKFSRFLKARTILKKSQNVTETNQFNEKTIHDGINYFPRAPRVM